MSDIILQNGCPVFVGLDDSTELGFTNVGQWTISHVSYVAGGTNLPTSVSGVPQGTVVVVDASGKVNVSYAPDLARIGVWGFATAVTVIGTLLVIRYFGRFLRAGMAGNWSSVD